MAASEYAVAPRELGRDLDLAIDIIGKGPQADEDGKPPVDENGKLKKTLDDILDDISRYFQSVFVINGGHGFVYRRRGIRSRDV